MLLAKYQESGLLFYSNFLEQTPQAGLFGYRGDLVLTPGDVGDDKGRTLPPKEIVREVVILADDKLKMVIGGLDKIASLPNFVAKYKADFAPEMKAIFYVVNIKNAAQVKLEGVNFVLIPLVQGVPWNETMEELALEKSDFKGQEPAEKVLTMYNEMLNYAPKYPHTTLEDVLAATTNAVREIHGAV